MDISFVALLLETYPKEFVDIFTEKFIDEDTDINSLCELYKEMFILY